ncbi:oxygenase MpaB family protein [Frateuria edaphi]|uniref:oxygenase MpaB family protein n=1 Tax=Frateuria edaphi TaxID=2898793 RepID=UPI001E3241AC|nr:oxygenase MpaB family protein [Frateuria edaphi]UGB44731.1 oxygenase MpaB family protein [Frateuria edaphi]
MASPLHLLRRATHEPIRRWVVGAFPRDPGGSLDYDHPRGDPGLFGPDSVTWRIHADFPGMLAGGLAALMMQTLHPLALAGVWDHSNFRGDLVGRLRRTTTFVGATTYAPRAAAQGLIERVRHIHGFVRGTSEDGTPYSADDPALLTWVHVTEAHSFLAGYRRFAHRAVPRAIADRYYDEVRRVAEALGARNVPASEGEANDYFAGIRPQLAYTDRSREVLRILADVRLPVPLAGLSRDVFLNAGIALLPAWASELLRHTPRQRQQARVAARLLWSMAPAFRAALKESGVVSRSCRRVGVAPEAMRRWPAPGDR